VKRSPLIAFALLMAGLILLAAFSYVQHQRLNQLSTEYERLQGLLESLLDLENAILTDEYTVNGSAFRYSVGHSVGCIVVASGSRYVICSLTRESTLEVDIALTNPIPIQAYLPFSVWREEDAPIPLSQVATDQTNETAVLMWEANVTASGTFSIRLPLTGWYVISIHGPENVPEEIDKITIPYTLTLRMKRLGGYVSFLVCPKLSTSATEESARQVLTEEEVRRLIMEHPGAIHFEVRPETIEFLSLELMPIEESPLAEEIGEMENFPDKVWVVEYECEGRVWLGTIGPPPPFTRKFVRVVIDAYTGQQISCHAEDAPYIISALDTT